MNCCICEKPIELSESNSPFPLCAREDNSSRCCVDCNQKVTRARLRSMYSHSSDKTIKVGDTLEIFYSKNSSKPTEFINNHEFGFLTGTVESVEEKGSRTIYTGTWDNFEVDSSTDQFIKIDD